MKTKQLILAAGVVIFVVFGSALKAEMFWDDVAFIKKNDYLKSFEYVPEIFTQSATAGSGQINNYYRPLMSLSFLIDGKVWGEEEFGYHLSNLVIHLLGGVGLVYLLRELGVGEKVALVMVLVFLVHPVQTVPVVYVSARGTAMYSMWLMWGGVWFSRALKAKRKERLLVLSTVSLVLAILSMETGIVGVGLFGLIWLKKVAEDGGVEMIFDWKRLWKKYKKEVMSLGSMVGVVVGYLYLRLTALNFLNSLNFVGVADDYSQNLYVRMFSFGKIFWRYLGLLAGVGPVYMEKTSTWFYGLNGWWVGMLVLIGGVFWLGWREYKREGKVWIWFGWLWFLGLLVPVSGLVPINALMSDHWLYLALVGFFIVVWRLCVWFGGERLFVWGMLMACLVFGIKSKVYAQKWVRGVELFEYTLTQVENASLRLNLGVVLAVEGDYERAEKELKRAIEIRDTYPQSHHVLGIIYEKWGEVELAESEFKRAIELDETFFPGLKKLVSFYLSQGDFESAYETCKRLTEVGSKTAEYWLMLGKIELIRSNGDAAEEAFKKGVEVGGEEVLGWVEEIRGSVDKFEFEDGL